MGTKTTEANQNKAGVNRNEWDKAVAAKTFEVSPRTVTVDEAFATPASKAEAVMSAKPAPEVFHSRFDCDLCGHEDNCVKAYGVTGHPHLHSVVICSACIEHMSQLYDEYERLCPWESLRRNDVKA
jgi:hypothetical protein